MRTKPIKMLIARGGGAELGGGDSFDESMIKGFYDIGAKVFGGLIEGNGFTLEDAAICYSAAQGGNKAPMYMSKSCGSFLEEAAISSASQGTQDTARAFMAGAYGLPMPESVSDLRDINLDGLAESGAASSGFWALFNMDAMKVDGRDAYLRKWMTNRDSDEYDGKTITDWRSMENNCGSNLAHAVSRCYFDDRNVAAYVTSGGLIESTVSALINSGIERLHDGKDNDRMVSYDEMGGQFNQGDHAVLTVTPGGFGSSPISNLERDGREFPVDFHKLRGGSSSGDLFFVG